MPIDVELPYSVVYATSHDQARWDSDKSFRTDYLNGKGWLSARMCNYPQEVVIRFKKTTKINLIQVLCHDQYIPTTMAIFVGQPRNNRNMNPNPTEAKYSPIGDVTFLPQMETSHPDKERKTIHASCTGLFIKFVFYSPHKTRMNMAGQVGVHSIRVWGPKEPNIQYDDDSDDPDDDLAGRIAKRYNEKDYDLPETENAIMGHPLGLREHPRDPHHQEIGESNYNRGKTPKKKLAIPFDVDLTKYKELLKSLKDKKQDAIKKEKYLEARELKEMIDYLEIQERRMHFLNYQRKVAIEKEDFDKAQECKEEFEDIKENAPKRMRNLPEYLTKTERDRYDVPSEYESSDEERVRKKKKKKKESKKKKEEKKTKEKYKYEENYENDKPIQQSYHPGEEKVQQILQMERNDDQNLDPTLDDLVQDLNDNEQLHCDPRVQEVMRRREVAGVQRKINSSKSRSANQRPPTNQPNNRQAPYTDNAKSPNDDYPPSRTASSMSGPQPQIDENPDNNLPQQQPKSDPKQDEPKKKKKGSGFVII